MKSVVKYMLAATLVITAFASCEQELLEEEQYKKVIYLKSGDNNIFAYTHAMNDSLTRGFLTVGSGGSMPLDEDVIVSLELDPEALEKYNRRNFDIEYHKYARLLSPDRYVIPSSDVMLRAGEISATTFFPIEVDANGLSPDSSYIVPLRIKSTSPNYEVNEEKNFVLYSVQFKNAYSEPKLNSYKSKGTKLVDGGAPNNINIAAKRVLPISKNRVRFLAGDLNNGSSTLLSDIENKSIIAVVNSDNTLRLKPYKNLELEQMEGCHYNPELGLFKLFYRYRVPGETAWTTVVESLMRLK